MEIAGVRKIYERFVARNVRYLNYLGDGDFSSFKTI